MSRTYGSTMSARLLALFAALAFALLSVAGPGALAAMAAAGPPHASSHDQGHLHSAEALQNDAPSALCADGAPCGAPDAAGCERICAGLVALVAPLPEGTPPPRRAACPRPGPDTGLIGATPAPTDRPPIA